MFVRKKPNKSGVVSVQVIDKSSGRYRVIKTIGSSTDASEIERLEIEGRQWITHQKGVLSLDLNDLERQADVFFDHIESVKPAGTDLLLGKIFDEIGFSAIASPLFKSLVLSRIANPVSKLKTTDYWFEHYGVLVSVAEVYRYLDKLHKEEKPRIEQISFEHTRQVLGTAMLQMVFYDVTTIYFEAEQEDELRKTGFSKDGKSAPSDCIRLTGKQ